MNPGRGLIARANHDESLTIGRDVVFATGRPRSLEQFDRFPKRRASRRSSVGTLTEVERLRVSRPDRFSATIRRDVQRWPPAGNCWTYTSFRPDSLDVYASHRPSGEIGGPPSLNRESVISWLVARAK